MAAALDQHHHIIRELIAQHKGYEVKTVGDSFMIVFSDALSAVKLVRDVQLRFQETQFPAAIAEVYAAGEDDDKLSEIDDDPLKLAELHPVFNGVRVRIGMHVGFPECQFDDVAKGYDYYGPPVNVAARVESAGKGGQILCSQALAAKISDPNGLGITLNSVGTATLKGVAEPMELFELTPDGLSARQFPKLEAHSAAGEKNDDATGEDMEPSDNGKPLDLSIVSETISLQGELLTITGPGPTGNRGGNAGGGPTALFIEPFKKFLGAVFKTASPKEKKQMVEQLSKLWRLRLPPTASDEDHFEALARRVAPTIRKELEGFVDPKMRSINSSSATTLLRASSGPTTTAVS